MIYIILFLISTNICFSQDNLANYIVNKSFDKLINEKSLKIEFDYVLKENEKVTDFETIQCVLYVTQPDSYKIDIKSLNLSIIYKDDNIFTILDKEQEIHIDNNNQMENDIIFLIKEYKNYFKANIVNKDSTQTTINMITKKENEETIYNTCIDKLELPICLKKPSQCKIGLSNSNKIKLKNCLENTYLKNDSGLSFKIIINNQSYEILSIIAMNDNENQSSINVKNISSLEDIGNIFNLKNQKYDDYEIIDLR